MSSFDAKPPAGPPARLYKYRSMEEGKSRKYTLAILENRELHYSSASRFNDPFDCNLDIAFRSSEEWEELFGDAVERLKSRLASGWAKVAEAGRAWLAEKGIKVPPPPATRSDPKPQEAAKSSLIITDSQGRQQDTAEFFNRAQAKRMRRFYQLLDESFGVLCLSKPNDDILLWSHYANRHDGLCLEFDAAGHPDAFPRLHPVTYQDGYPDIPAEFPELLELLKPRPEKGRETQLLDLASLFAPGLSDGSVNAEDPAAAVTLAIARWFYVKSSHWSYEGEWRCLKWKPGRQSFPARALKGVIVGCVNTEANLELVRTALKGKRPAIALFKAIRKPRAFGIDIVAVD